MTVNLSALAGAGQQFFDNNGNPLSGGKLWSYQAGTTTPQTTYTTAVGNVAHTNPIILDSAGRVATGEIWLTAGANYKFVLMTSADVTLATWDNITGINGTGIASNASNVQYDPAGTNAVATTVQAKLRQIVSVKDFGATGDGITNDRAAIQSAIDAVRNAGGGTVYFPEGSYLINSVPNASIPDGYDTGILVSYTGNPNSAFGRVRLLGDGASTILLAGNNNMMILRYGDSHGVVESMTFDGNGKTNVVGMLHGPESLLSTTETYQIYNVYKDLYFQNLAYGWWGQSSNTPFGACYYATLQDSFFFFCNVGLYIPPGTQPNGSCGRSLFQNLRVGQNCNVGLYATGGIGTMTFVHCNFENISQGVSPLATPTAIHLDGFCDGGTFINTTIEGCTRDIYNNGSFVYWFGGNYTGTTVFAKEFRLFASADIKLGGGNLIYTQPNFGANDCYLEVNPSATPAWNLRFNGSVRQRIGVNGYNKFTSDGSGYASSGDYHEFIGKDNAASLYVTSTAASQSGAGANIGSAFNTAQGANATLYGGDDGGVRVYRVRSDGNVYNTNGVYAAISDPSLKNFIASASSQWDDVKNFKFYKYQLKNDQDGRVQLGVNAEELKQTSPSLVDDFVNLDGSTSLSVKYSILYMKAVIALQEAMARIEALESKVGK